MLINYQKLINLPVVTESGSVLGKVTKIDIESESQTIFNYYVKSSNLVKGLFEGELIINKSQIIEITEKKIIVEDNVCQEKIAKNKGFFDLKKVKSGTSTINPCEK